MSWLNSNNEKQKSMECHLQSTEREELPNEKSALQENLLHEENKTKTASEMEKMREFLISRLALKKYGVLQI